MFVAFTSQHLSSAQERDFEIYLTFATHLIMAGEVEGENRDRASYTSRHHNCCCYNELLISPSEFSVDSVSYQLLTVKFPPEKWCTLARGLRVASAVSKIDVDHRDVDSKLLAVISHWVKSNTQHNQWITLVEAVIMCDECGVAEQLATAVGVEYTPPPPPPGMHATVTCNYEQLRS